MGFSSPSSAKKENRCAPPESVRARISEPAPTPGSSSTARERRTMCESGASRRAALGGARSLDAESAHRRASVVRIESESERMGPAMPIANVPRSSLVSMSATSPKSDRIGGRTGRDDCGATLDAAPLVRMANEQQRTIAAARLRLAMVFGGIGSRGRRDFMAATCRTDGGCER